jgi:drug/metabolite transporter (DMT)-like permease
VNNLVGALWMIMAMACFALVDTCIKLATESVPRAQVVVVMGAVGLLAFALAARARGLKPMPPAIFRGPSLLRAAGEAGATTCFVFSLSEVDLSLFTTIVQANPLIVVLGAALFLGEPVGWRRWAAIVLGMVGVLIVLRPTGEDFNAFALLVFLGVLSQSIRDLATRRVAPGIHTLQLSCGSFLALIGAGFVIGIVQDTPPMRPQGLAWLYLFGAAGLFMPAIYAMVAAMRVGEIGFVAPFRYSRILFGLGLGVVIFGETLDAYTLSGAALIVGTGLYSFWRETRKRPAQGAPG